MKLGTLILLLLSVNLYTYSQLTLTRDHLPNAGDTLKIALSSGGFSMNLSETGENIDWDFSHLSENFPENEITWPLSAGGTIITFQFGNFAAPKHQADLIQDYHGLPIKELLDMIPFDLPIDIPIESMQQILKEYDDRIERVGYSMAAMGQKLGFKSDTTETIYQFPMEYLDTFYSSGYTRFNLSPIIDIEMKMHRQSRTVADGYGTLKTPYNTYENVMRLHTVITELDSIKIPLGEDPFWFPLPRTIHEYEWWSEDFKRPIMKVETDGILGVNIPRRVTFIYDPLDPYKHVGDAVFPNPAEDYIIVHTTEFLEEVLLYNLEGQIIQQYFPEPGMNFAELDLTQVAAGRYVIVAVTEEKKQAFRIIVL